MKDFFKFLLASVLGVMLAGFLGFILLIGVFTAMLSFSEEPVIVKENSVLVLSLDNELVERSENNPLANMDFLGISGTGQTGLDDILESIEKAKTDDKILGIYLKPSSVDGGIATLEEIRNALIDFKESGKFIYAYGENLSQKAYYLVSVADKIVLNPMGTIEFKGLSAQVTFYKGILEKLGIEVQVIRHGKFKAAVEPYILDEMSDANRLQTETYVGSIWDQIVSQISASRGISSDKLNDIADGTTSLRKAEYLMENGLVDALLYKDEVLTELKEMTNIAESDDINTVSVDKYKNTAVQTDGKGLARDKIAVIYASGGIDMESNGETIDSEELSGAIRGARRDSTVKAIVLRINSPGGSAYGSEVIWREVKLAAEAKPLIASMGDYAASGGYYIAAAADTIMADYGTITGSIGVFGTIPNISELLNDKLGITIDVVNTNEHSDILSLTRPMTDYEEAIMQEYVDVIYDTFTERVSDGRQITKEEVDEIGQGRVWDSTNAMNIGLVDLYGGVDDAIELAAEIAGLDRYRVLKLPEMKDPFEELLESFSTSVKTKILRKQLGDEYEIYQQLQYIRNARGVYSRIPYDITIQ